MNDGFKEYCLVRKIPENVQATLHIVWLESRQHTIAQISEILDTINTCKINQKDIEPPTGNIVKFPEQPQSTERTP
jgi:hypothetical protein